MNTMRQAGATLIELMIAIVVVAILLALGAPSFSRWIQSSQIRTAAEAIQNGLMLARAEAVRRNTNVRFQLVTTTTDSCDLSANGTNWVVSLDSAVGLCDQPGSDTDVPRIIQMRSGREGSPNVAIDGNGVSTITFNGLGQADVATTINVTNPSGGACATDMRCLSVIVSTGGQIRMCDPHPGLAATDPRRC